MISNVHILVFCAVDSGSGGIILVSEDGNEGLSGGALSGIVILGLLATLMAITVALMVVYIRYNTLRTTQSHEMSPLVSENT